MIDADADTIRTAVVASRVLDYLRNARVLQDGAEPDSRGVACRLSDGQTVFKMSPLVDELGRTSDRITRRDVSQVLTQVGGGIYRCRDSNRTRLQELDAAALARLVEFTAAGQEDEP